MTLCSSIGGKGYPGSTATGSAHRSGLFLPQPTCEAYLFSSWLSVTAKNPGILSFDYMVDGSEENDLKIAVEDGNELVTISGKRMDPFGNPSGGCRRKPNGHLDYTNWDKESTDSYAAFSNMKFETGTAELNLTVKGTGRLRAAAGSKQRSGRF